MLKNMTFVLAVLFLAGCSAKQRDVQQNAPLTVSLPVAPAEPDTSAIRGKFKEDLHQEVTASTQAINQNMGGMVDVAVNKLAEKMVGMENHLDHVMDIHNEANLKMVTDLKIQLQSTITANADLRVNAEAELQLIKDLKVQIGTMQTTLQAQANLLGQAGIGNKIEQKTQTNSAGGDLNQNSYLPKESVDMLINICELFSGIVIALIGLYSTALVLSFKASRTREQARTKAEGAERQAMFGLLLELLAQNHPNKASLIARWHDHSSKSP